MAFQRIFGAADFGHRVPVSAGILSVLVLGLQVACGGGSGGSGGGSGDGSGGGNGDTGGDPGSGTTMSVPRAVYLADQDRDLVDALYTVKLSEPGIATRINPELPPGGKVSSFAILPDGSGVVYRAEQRKPFVDELFLARFDDSGPPQRLNPALADGQAVDYVFRLTPDGRSVIYSADQQTRGVLELFIVDIDRPGFATRLSAEINVPGGDVSPDFVLDAAGTQVLYRADAAVNNRFELFRVALDRPGVAVRVHPELRPGADVSSEGYGFSPDGSLALYIADQDVNERRELYVVDLAQPGVSRKLNAGLNAGGRVLPGFVFSPDGEQIAYRAHETGNTANLMLVAARETGASTRLNPALAAPVGVSRWFEFSADGQGLLYAANEQQRYATELHSVAIANPQASSRLVAGHGEFFRFNQARDRVLFVADREAPELLELYVYDIGSSAPPRKLNPALVEAGDVVRNTPVWYSQDTRVAYIADQDENARNELYTVDPAVAGVATKLNAALAVGGDVKRFEIYSGPPPSPQAPQ